MEPSETPHASIKAPKFLSWKPLKSKVKTTSRLDQRNNFIIIKKRVQQSLNQLYKLVPTPNQITKQQSFQIEKNKRRKTYKITAIV